MVDAFTDTTSLANQVTTAYEQYAYFALRPELYFDACADIKPTRQSHRGSTVQFNIYQDLAPTVAPLPETSDIDAVTVADDIVTVALDEYGNAAITSARVRGFSFLEVNEDVANVIGYNGGISFDSLARNPLLEGTNVAFAGDAAVRTDLNAGDTLAANDVRQAGAELNDDSVQRVMNGYYKAFISPLVSFDLRSETGAAAWRDPHTFSQPEEIWNGEIGAFESFSFIETPRLSAPALETAQGGPGGFVDGGQTGTGGEGFDVFPTLFLGRQALAKTWSEFVSAQIPQIVLGTVVDKLQRLVPIGWYWLGGFGRFREESLRRVESISSIGANTTA